MLIDSPLKMILILGMMDIMLDWFQASTRIRIQ